MTLYIIGKIVTGSSVTVNKSFPFFKTTNFGLSSSYLFSTFCRLPKVSKDRQKVILLTLAGISVGLCSVRHKVPIRILTDLIALIGVICGLTT